MRTTYHYIENEDGLLPVEVELLLDYTFNAEVIETLGSYSGDTPGEPAHISNVTLIDVEQVRLNDIGLFFEGSTVLLKLLKQMIVVDFRIRMNSKVFMQTLTEHCEKDYTEKHEVCDE